MDISGISSLYDYSTLSSSPKSNLEDKLSSDLSTSTEDELMDACKEFEAYFVEQMFKAMERMIPEREDESSTTKNTMDYFGDMLTQEYAKTATEGEGLGIAQMLYEQMKRNYDL